MVGNQSTIHKSIVLEETHEHKALKTFQTLKSVKIGMYFGNQKNIRMYFGF